MNSGRFVPAFAATARSNSKPRRARDKEMYKRRLRIEIFFAKIKEFRALATRRPGWSPTSAPPKLGGARSTIDDADQGKIIRQQALEAQLNFFRRLWLQDVQLLSRELAKIPEMLYVCGMDAHADLIDPFHRKITYLRVSVTDRCDFRCVYCMSENMTFLPKKEILTLEELDRACTAFINLGVRKLRITGGEPLVRRGIMSLFESISRHLENGRLKELTLTTNGSQLARYAEQLAACGVRRVNVSLDTLVPEKFADITRWGRLNQVMAGIDAAKKAGLRIKINTVALKGFNDVELFDIVDWCNSMDMDLTFIEVMPMGDIGNEERLDRYWSLESVRAQLARMYTVTETTEYSGGPARYARLEETGQKIGFITPLSHNFCESCNRVRLTCTGELFMCLGQEDKADLRTALRNEDDRDGSLFEEAIREAIARKPKGHDFDYSRQTVSGRVSRHMSHTGG